jgi:polysaccharide export outer membrane protein
MRTGIAAIIIATALLATLNGGALATQIIVPGDMISITVTNEPEFTRTVIVDSSGNISLQKAGPVILAGLSITEAASTVAAALSEYVKSAQVTVSIASLAPRTATITGQVAKPGTYPVTAATTLADLIDMSGGPTREANLGRVVVTRKYGSDKLIAANLEAFKQGIDSTGNPTIAPGDSVLVPVKPIEGGSVYTVGEVLLKGPVPYRQGITVREALAAGGGPNEFADVTKVTVKRDGQPDKVVDYAKVVADDPNSNIVLEKGDSVFLPAVEITGAYTVKGEVNNPSEYLLRGVTKLTDAIKSAGGPKAKADRGKIKIARMVEGKKKTLDYSLDDIYAERAADPIIQPGDIVTVSSKGSKTSPGRLAGALIGLFLLIGG